MSNLIKKLRMKIKKIFDKLKRLFTSRGTDKSIYASVIILSVLGVVMIGSAAVGGVTDESETITLAVRMMISQTVFVIAGVIMMIFLARVFKTRFIGHTSSLTIYVVGIIAMIICVFWSDSKGSHAWIKLGSISIQPAEFMKIAMILILSYFLTENESSFKVKGEFRDEEMKREFSREKLMKCVVLPMILVGVVVSIGLFVQEDFGTTVILALICFMCFIATPRRYYKKYKRIAWLIIAIGSVVLVVLGTLVLEPYQLNRIYIWLDPLIDPSNRSYQIINSLIAFSNGGLFGLGFGNSKQKFGYIPESHNDFIGAIIYEELGLFGLALIIVPTGIIIFKLLKYSNEVKENKSKIILLGIASYFFFHLLINLGGVSGLIPMTGVPILLVSDGGSSTICAFISIGIAQAIIAKHNRQKYSLDSKYVPDLQ